MVRNVLSLLSILFVSSVSAQIKLLDGNLTSETSCTSFENQVFIGFKEYTQPSTGKTQKMHKTGMMTYMDLPLDAKHASVHGDNFESRLACFQNGNLKWTKTLGMTHTSSPPALAQDSSGAIYTGEKIKDQRAITLYKYDSDGNEIWKKKLDSLESIHKIYVDNSNYLTALVSFTTLEKVTNKKTFTYKSKFVYHTIKLNKMTGSLISKRVNEGPTYFCGEGYSRPTLESHGVHYFFKGDSLLYSRTDTLHMLTVSQDELNNHKVVDVTGNDVQYYVVAQNRKSGKYQLVLNRWKENASLKKEQELPVDDNIKIHEVLMTERGVSIIHEDQGVLRALHYSKELELLGNEVLLDDLANYAVCESFTSSSGSINLVLIKKQGQSRSIWLLAS